MRHFLFQVVMVLGALLFASAHADAQLNETFKLTASDADFFDEFGWSVAVTALCVSTRRRSCCPTGHALLLPARCDVLFVCKRKE